MAARYATFRLLSVGLAVAVSASASAQTPAPEAAPAAPAAAPVAAPAPATPAPSEAPAAAGPVGHVVEATEAAPAAEPLAGYDKGFFIRSADGKNELGIQARVQARFTYLSRDPGMNDANFSIPRARLTLHGHLFGEDLSYKFQTDFGKGNATLKDFYLDYQLLEDTLVLRVGQYKKPFSRQQLTSSGNQELVDRAITDKAFGAGRDIGFSLQNNFEKSPTFEYSVGLFNGTGDKPWFEGTGTSDVTTGEVEITKGEFTTVPSTFNPTPVARVGYNHGELKGYSEADLEGGDLRFGVGASGLADLNADQDDKSSVRGELDYVLKAQGFATTGAVYVSSVQSGAGFSDRSLGALGFHVQAGYVFDKTYQPVVRFALVSPKGSDNNTQELALGLSLYSEKHNFKWQTDVAALTAQIAGGKSETDAQLRSQVQAAF
jgi:Phosphate-selective porin O and P